MEKNDKFKLDIEIIYPCLRVVSKYFASLKVMRQWQKRNDLDHSIVCFGYKEFIFINEQLERFTIIGKRIVTLSELYALVHKLEK
jgi:hypothetical protein